MNLFDDILRLRIEKAKEYMETSDKKVYEISQAVGFEDTGYFSRVFKKYTGMSPKEYKNEKKKHRISKRIQIFLLVISSIVFYRMWRRKTGKDRDNGDSRVGKQ